jgi:hypothetical protein
VLNYCHSKGVKVIFSIKDAMPGGATNQIQKSWNGISDPIEMSEAAVNRLDPDHPTYAIYYQFNSYPRYLGCQDIFGIDPYPIKQKTDNDLSSVVQQASHAVKVQRLAGTGGVALWAAPQYTNPGVWLADGKNDPKIYYEKYRFPTANELRAMIALEMIYGAKGFIGYSYSSLFYGPDKKQFENTWPIIQDAVALQRELAPFILSETVAPEVNVTSIRGTVYAKTFALPEGQIRVLAVSQGLGDFEASLELDAGNLKSRYGNIRQKSPGLYEFNGSGICFDMLEP